MEFAYYPPEDQDTLIGRLLDKHLKPWRENAKARKAELEKPKKQDKKLLEHLKKSKEEQTPYMGPPIPSDQVDSMVLTRMVPVKRGNWRIFSPEIEKNAQNK